MAKRRKPAKQKGAEDRLVDALEQAIRNAISEAPGIMDVTEHAYCEAVLAAMDAIRVGIEMRKHEIEEEN